MVCIHAICDHWDNSSLIVTSSLYLSVFFLSLILQTPLEKAQACKNKGNKYFKGGKFSEAINCYDQAIEMCPPENTVDLSTFYQNRAAAYEQQVRSNWKQS